MQKLNGKEQFRVPVLHHYDKRIPSFRLTLLGVLAVILTLRNLNQFFDE